MLPLLGNMAVKMCLVALLLASCTVVQGQTQQCRYGVPNDGCPNGQHCHSGQCVCNCPTEPCDLPPCKTSSQDVDMLAIVVDEYAPNLTAVHTVNMTIPPLAPGEVFIRVEASSVNPIDYKVLDGTIKGFFPLQFPQILGADIVGTVLQSNSPRLRVNSRVWGDLGTGSTSGAWASYAVAPAEGLSEAPSASEGDALSSEDLATMPLVAKTMWQALELADHVFTADRKSLNESVVVITSGTGGTGTMGIQIARARGASHVVTTAGNPAAPALVEKLGANRVVDYHSAALFDVLEDNSVDVVIDNYGYDPDAAMKALRPGGVFVSLTHATPTEGKSGVSNYTMFCNASRHDDLDALASLVSKRQLQPVVAATFPMAGIIDAIHYTQKGGYNGKVALTTFDYGA